MSSTVAWWDQDLSFRHGGARLAGLDVYYDFHWDEVFGHGRTTFPGGQSLARLVREACPDGLTPTLCLTERDEVSNHTIETDDGRFVVVVRIDEYRARSAPDRARSFYGALIGPRVAMTEDLRELAKRPEVVRAVVQFGLALGDIEFWASLVEGRREQLEPIVRPRAVPPTVSAEQAVEALRELIDVSPAVIDRLRSLVAPDGPPLESRVRLLGALLEEAFTDEKARAAFLSSNGDLLAAMLKSNVEAPDVVALARRRSALTRFERLLSDKRYFDAEMSRLSVRPEGVWQRLVEENPWVLGSTLAPQFLHSWSEERLEQTVKGFSIAGPGKRADAVLRTAGALSALVLAEIKHHRTDLLSGEYRPGAWRINPELAGGVAQCQATADETQAALGKTVDLKSEDGYVIERAFVCRPRTILVVGSLTEFLDVKGNAHHDKFLSFERFRRSLRDPEILTFDELYERARLALALEQADAPTNDQDYRRFA